MDEVTLVGDKSARMFINLPIRRIIIKMDKSDMFYSAGQLDKDKREVVSFITQDREIFEESGREVYYLNRKNKNGEFYVWKKISNMPVIVEYDDAMPAEGGQK